MENMACIIRRVSGVLDIFLSSLVCHLHDLGRNIWGGQIVLHVCKILQNFWLTQVWITKNVSNFIKAKMDEVGAILYDPLYAGCSGVNLIKIEGQQILYTKNSETNESFLLSKHFVVYMSFLFLNR